jgi:xylan 1,4-beta-xylosidase
VGFRKSHKNGSATTSLTFTAQQEKEKAGLVVFQNDQHFYSLFKSIKNNQPVVQL